MTHADKFKLCLETAHKIVAAYRQELPRGFDPQNSGLAIASIIASVGATAYGAYSKNKAAKAATAAGAFGTKALPAKYHPIDIDEEQLKAIMGNTGALGSIQDLVTGSNHVLTENDLHRAKKLIPGYKQLMSLQGGAANDLLSGRLPYDDVLGIAADRSELTGALGTPGTAGPATLRDLGLSRLDAIGKGGGILKDMVNIAGQISPTSRYSKPNDFFVDPLERIKLRINEQQTMQQSEQSANFLNARGDPAAQAQFMLGDPNAGYVDAASQLLAALGKQYGASQQPTGSYVGQFGSNPVAGTQNRIYRPNSIPA